MDRVLFEFEDRNWFPDFLRTYMTDYLQFIFSKFNLYSPVVPVLRKLLTILRTNSVVDLCSGSGGPLPAIKKLYERSYGEPLIITLTDKFPPANISVIHADSITYDKRPLDAEKIPHDVQGLRTMFSSLHHFSPATVTRICKDSIVNDQAIALFDGGNKNLLMIISIIVLHPVGLLLFTPFIRPFSLGRVFFTYLVPLVIFFTVWDGIISILNLYKTEELEKIFSDNDLQKYTWNIGTLYNHFGMKIVYITGISKKLNVGII